MKIFRLLMNEFAKIFRRRGLMTVFILIVLNSFLAGLGVYDSSSYSGTELFLENELEDYRRLVKTYTDQIADYESMLPPADESADTVSDMSEDASQDTEQESTFYKSLNELRFSLLEAKTYVSVYERALELSITSADDWRYSVLYDIINGETKIACYEEILDADEDDEDYIATVICTYLEISSNYTAAEIRAKLAVQKDNLDSLWESVETGDYGAYCKNEITALQYEQAAKQSELEMINRQLEDNPSSIELSLSKRKAEGAKGAVEGKIEIQKYRYQNGIEFKSWVDRTLDLMLEKYDSYISLLNSFVTEEYFHKNGDYYEWTYADYGEYSALMNSDLQSCLDSVSIGWYSIENGVEELSVADSTRENMLGFSDMFLFFSFFAIVVAGISVSGEYITRTIYLLLIRPAKRYKILLSKYLSAAVAVMSLIALSFGAYLLASVLTHGSADLSLPYMYVSNGAVTETSFLYWMAFRVLYCTASVMFLMTIAFMASALFRNTAFSIALGLFTYFSSMLLASIFRNSTLYGYLPFPYFNISSFVYNDMSTLASRGTQGIYDSIVVYPVMALVWLGALTVICLLIAFASFTRRDVTNT